MKGDLLIQKLFSVILKYFTPLSALYFWNFEFVSHTLESEINIQVRLLIFEVFSRSYVLIKGGYVYWFLIFKNFLQIFNFLFLWLCIKESNHLLFKRGLRLFKGLLLLFLPNFPGATFIQGATFIPDSRVLNTDQIYWQNFTKKPFK